MHHMSADFETSAENDCCLITNLEVVYVFVRIAQYLVGGGCGCEERSSRRVPSKRLRRRTNTSGAPGMSPYFCALDGKYNLERDCEKAVSVLFVQSAIIHRPVFVIYPSGASQSTPPRMTSIWSDDQTWHDATTQWLAVCAFQGPPAEWCSSSPCAAC